MDKFSNLIIPTWDSRYGKLGNIFSHDWVEGDLFIHPPNKSIQYFIPPELVINSYVTYQVSIKTQIEYTYDNYISNRAPWLITRTTGLSPQELFDLTVLKINNIQDRPRCSHCHKLLDWSGRYTHGYYGDGEWVTRRFNYCSDRCRTRHMNLHQDYYTDWAKSRVNNIQYLIDYRTNIKSCMHQFINLGSPDDKCSFYIAHWNNRVKLGVSHDVQFRSYNWGNSYDDYEVIFECDRVNIAYFEAVIKLNLKSAKEDFDITMESEIRKLVNKIYSNGWSNPFK